MPESTGSLTDQLSALWTESFYLNPYGILFLIASVFVLFLGIYVFIHGSHPHQKVSFLGFSVSIFLWLTGTYFVYFSKNEMTALKSVYVTYMGVNLISPTLFWYASAWTEQTRKNRPLIILGFVSGFLLSFLIIATSWIVKGVAKFFWGYHSQLTLWGGVALLSHFSIFMLLFFYTLYQGFRLTDSADKRRQIRIVAIAFIIANLGCSDFMPCYGIEIFPLGGLFMFIACCVLAYTIIRYKLLDIESVLHKTVMWFITSSIVGVPIVVFYLIFKDEVYHLSNISYGSLIGATVLGGIYYVRNIQPKIDHFFQRRQWNLMLAMESFADDLVQMKTLEEVKKHILMTVKRLFYAGHVSLMVVTHQGNRMTRISGKNEISDAVPPETNSLWMQWLEKTDMLVQREFLSLNPKFNDIKDEAESYFKKVDAILCVPLVVNQQLVGLLNIGRKENLKNFSNAEMTFLADFRRSAAIAISNALHINVVKENLQRWNEELERKVDERTKQLQSTQAQLFQAEKLATIGTLAGGVAHEINNPLTAVLTNAQILKMTANEEDLESISLIEEGAKRCQIIIQSLLKYARKADTADVPLSPVDVSQVVGSACQFLMYQFKQENIEIVTAIKDVPKISGMANELEQVLTNLLINARDAIRKAERPGHIRIETKEENKFVIIRVEDDGVGIEEKIINKIFDPFFTTKDVGGGTGLGLAVSLSIIRKHQGEITVRSEVGKGTVFTLKFPIMNASRSFSKMG